MKALLLALLLTVEEAPKPKLQVYPRISIAPATVILTLSGIPEDARVACFVLDGDDYYSEGCTDPDGRKSIRREERDIPQGEYRAAASINGKWLPALTFIVN